MTSHVVLPDTQVKPGVPIDHLTWIGRFVLEVKPDKLICLGDHADFPSLSTYDRGKRQFEGRRVKEDIHAARHAMFELLRPLEENKAQKKKNKKGFYWPEMHLTMGNHEYRADRAADLSPELEGLIGSYSLAYEDFGWTVHPFLKIVTLDGVQYAHYFYNPNSGRPYGGTVDNRLRHVGTSFTAGHEQGKKVAELPRNGGKIDRGLIVGSCYLHDEDYKGPQGNGHWRGIILKENVEDGNYDLHEISLQTLCLKYEQMSLMKFVKEKYPGQCPSLEGLV